jgi:hypothetical protein
MAPLHDQQSDACHALYEQGKDAACIELGERTDQQSDACYALYEPGKNAECVELGERNLTDPGMSPYLRIKTHFLIAGAADEWLKAEVRNVSTSSH